MTFLSPIWLWLLIPWTVLVYWMFRQQQPEHPVPFIPLWKAVHHRVGSRRSLRPPESWVILILLALLVGILASAGPAWKSGALSDPLRVVLDRGGAMSARAAHHPTRFLESAVVAQNLIVKHWSARQPLEVVVLPEGLTRRISAGELAELAGELAPASYDDPDALTLRVVQARDQAGAPPIVLSDKPLPDHIERVQIVPRSRVENVGIEHFSAEAGQAMIRIVNDSDLRQVLLLLRDSQTMIQQRIELAPRGMREDFFVDLPPLGDWLFIRLEVEDGYAADNIAYLTMPPPWPVLEMNGSVPQALRRVVEAYGSVRPTGSTARRVMVTVDATSFPPSTPVANFMTPTETLPPDEPFVVAHEITRQVDWNRALHAARGTTAFPPEDWAVLVGLADRPLLAVVERPVRGVWVGFWSEEWTMQSDFVIFWTKIFDWLGFVQQRKLQAGQLPAPPIWRRLPEPSAGPAEVFHPAPGIHVHPDGTRLAFNARPPTIYPQVDTDVAENLKKLTREESTRSLSSPALLVSLGMMLAGVAIWGFQTDARSTRR